MKINSDKSVQAVFANYPEDVRPRLQVLRDLIIESAKELEDVDQLEETLKWGEPSYPAKHGSTIRLDWKAKTPNTYQMYFKCTTRLVPVFKEVVGELFKYEGSRAIIFEIDDEIPKEELKACIKAALTYHKVKKLDLLGIA